MRSISIKQTLATAMAGVAIAAAVAAPAASAAQDLRSADAMDAAIRAERKDQRSPDAVDAARAGQRQDLRSPDAFDAATRSDPAVPAQTTAVASPPSGGFDWVSGAIGAAGTGSLIVLLVLGGSAISGHRRTPMAPGSSPAK
jgi:hypothetical protein